MKKTYKKLYTEAGERLKNDPSLIPWDVYPRPHLRRKEWLNLNGFWELEAESGFKSSVRVPFPLESLLSGFEGEIRYGEKLVFKRRFIIPESWRGKRVILNVGSVSRMHSVFVNGRFVCSSRSAYDSFGVEITWFLREDENEIRIECINDLDPTYPYGKQRIKRGGMWYTPCTGVWQTIWLEPVPGRPERYIKDIVCRIEGSTVFFTVSGVWKGRLKCGDKSAKLLNGHCSLTFDHPRLWSPEEPNLYEFTVKSGEDEVESYFAFRTVETKTVEGVPRLCLNGKPYFFNGLLDQGYFSDGLWTPAEPEEYARDILKMKSLGFNMLRKHIKVEPELFYYYCDKLGMAVFQDMVNNGKYSFLRDTALPSVGITRISDRLRKPGRKTGDAFAGGMVEAVKTLKYHPSIVYWTIFNEGWGQFDADREYEILKQRDASRPIDSTSGWFHQKNTDVDSLHIYFKKLRMGKRRDLPQVISEFGGYVWKDMERSFNPYKTYGYRIFKTREEFVRGVRALYLNELLPLKEKGLSAAVYTQVSDVEDETNGILTFDRRVMKLSPEEFGDISEKLAARNERM